MDWSSDCCSDCSLSLREMGVQHDLHHACGKAFAVYAALLLCCWHARRQQGASLVFESNIKHVCMLGRPQWIGVRSRVQLVICCWQLQDCLQFVMLELQHVRVGGN